MTELYKIVLTSCVTIFGSVVVFVSGQVFSKFFIEPIHEQYKCIGEIADALIFYADLYCSSEIADGNIEEREPAANKLRQYASLIISKTHMIKCYGLFEKLRLVQTQKNICIASQELIKLSDSIYSDKYEGNMQSRLKIEGALNINVGPKIWEAD